MRQKKIVALFCILIALFIVLIARLFYLQIHLCDHLLVKSQHNFFHITELPSLRGNILDSTGHILATNQPIHHMLWQGTGNYTLTHAQEETLSLVETITGTPIITNSTLMKGLRAAERHKKQIILAANVALDNVSKIAEQLASCNNIQIVTDFKRYYPYGTVACHLLGYLGTIGIDYHGKMGLEKIMEDNLRGNKGSMLTIIDSLGRKVEHTPLQAALTGDAIYTTIDMELQQLCERIFPSDRTGACIIFDPADGAIKSIVSRPHFDPSLFLDGISHDTWQSFTEKKPFLNRALQATYPPGSVFKLITISAALEHNIMPLDTTHTCRGYYRFKGRKYWCSKHDGHGELTTAQAIAHSCNILFFTIGKQCDIDLLASYADIFGLGKKTGCELPESAGLVPNRAWKRMYKNEQWWPGETLSIAIGQSFLLVTPLQVAAMIGAICTGYRTQPRFLLHSPVIKTDLLIQESTRQFLQKSMKRVVKDGTGKRIKHIKEMKVFAKTSTAQMSALIKRGLGSAYLEHGWFAGYFSYKDHPPLVITIVVEHAGTGQVATTIAKNFLLAYKKRMDRVDTHKTQETAHAVTP